METARAIKGRRSLRSYQDRDIPDSMGQGVAQSGDPRTFFNEWPAMVSHCGQGGKDKAACVLATANLMLGALSMGLGGVYLSALEARFPIESKMVKALGFFGRQD